MGKTHDIYLSLLPLIKLNCIACIMFDILRWNNSLTYTRSDLNVLSRSLDLCRRFLIRNLLANFDRGSGNALNYQVCSTFVNRRQKPKSSSSVHKLESPLWSYSNIFLGNTLHIKTTNKWALTSCCCEQLVELFFRSWEIWWSPLGQLPFCFSIILIVHDSSTATMFKAWLEGSQHPFSRISMARIADTKCHSSLCFSHLLHLQKNRAFLPNWCRIKRYGIHYRSQHSFSTCYWASCVRDKPTKSFLLLLKPLL